MARTLPIDCLNRSILNLCFLSKQGAKLKSERVSWLSKIWVLYFMTDLGSLSNSDNDFFCSNDEDTAVSNLHFGVDIIYRYWHGCGTTIEFDQIGGWE